MVQYLLCSTMLKWYPYPVLHCIHLDCLNYKTVPERSCIQVMESLRSWLGKGSRTAFAEDGAAASCETA